MQEVSRRHRQVANAIREEIVTILRKDISDPRLEAAGMITVSGIDLSQDMKNATVWVSFMGKEEKDPVVEGALGALKKSSQYIHRLLIKRIPMKMHPRLVFRFDKIFDRAAKISDAFQEATELEKETAEFRKNSEKKPSEQE
jgi:ribosome-binding factor A